MTTELLLTIIQLVIGIFSVVIVFLLIIPKSHKSLPEAQPEPRRKQRGDFSYGTEVIFYPIYWLIKIIIAIFK
ncbi:hypothetical protein [Acinetobacter sp. 10FS3-1]|uniref:hypothetical protein n=1 Tax=Acinetobacter sp. 10FS3-1 TaxID=2563897 RepID=UPI00157D0369|nr:hypothetical protein [Acinetobacter sp. 10FS3-1]MDM1781967.1 hypothetical protein [Acinetobacter indicus]QKQ69470.1 hypothetical protein E5Y90_04070 [Acinetobacter sp. 10FS3-1]